MCHILKTFNPIVVPESIINFPTVLGEGQIEVKGTIYLVVIDKKFRDGRMKTGNDTMLIGLAQFLNDNSEKLLGPNGIQIKGTDSECYKTYDMKLEDDEKEMSWTFQFMYLQDEKGASHIWAVTVDGEETLFQMVKFPQEGQFELFENNL